MLAQPNYQQQHQRRNQLEPVGTPVKRKQPALPPLHPNTNATNNSAINNMPIATSSPSSTPSVSVSIPFTPSIADHGLESLFDPSNSTPNAAIVQAYLYERYHQPQGPISVIVVQDRNGSIVEVGHPLDWSPGVARKVLSQELNVTHMVINPSRFSSTVSSPTGALAKLRPPPVIRELEMWEGEDSM